MVGKILNGKYELLELVGKGGMASVYKANDLRLNRLVAIKVLKEKWANNEEFVNRLIHEAQASATLSHPNIVNIYDVDQDGNTHYIVMEYVPGMTLKDYMDNLDDTMTPKEAVRISLAVAEALSHAHKHGIIHRDIKPHNILLTKNLTPKVADFGIAQHITEDTSGMKTMGTVHYISPEQVRNQNIDERSDLYSLGIMMFEMLTDEVPFDDEKPVAIAIKHLREDVPHVREFERRVPKKLDEIVWKLTRRDPRERFQSADELIAALKEVYPEQGGTARAKGNFFERLLAFVKGQKTWVLVGGGILGALLLTLLVMWLVRGPLAKEVVVPNVVNLPLSQAETQLNEAGVKYEVTRQNSVDVVLDSVISQDIPGGTTIKNSRKVTLVVSDGPLVKELISVVGTTQAQATLTLTNENYKIGTITQEYSADVAAGTVISQEPLAGTQVAEGTAINLVISKGKDTAVITNFTGMTLTDVKAKLAELELKTGKISYAYSDVYAENIVMLSDPSMGTEVKKGSSVNLTVSKGKAVTKTVYINVSPYSGGGNDDVTLRIVLDDGISETDVYNGVVAANANVPVTMRGAGTCTYYVYINGSRKGSNTVTF